MSKRPAITYSKPVILVGGGLMAWPHFNEISDFGYPIIAVDAGAETLLSRQIRPDLILGDMDSQSPLSSSFTDIERLTIDEQETTDFEKALYSIEAPLYITFGFWGKRLDHSLAALHAVTRYRHQRRLILVDEIDLLFVPQGPFQMPCAPETRISIIPLAPVSFQRSEGLKYPLDGLDLEMGTAIGVSNETAESAFSITPVTADQNNYATILPAEHLEGLIAHLQQPPA